MPEGARELKAKASIVRRDKICTNCLRTVHRGEWIVECDCGRKYELDCAFDLRTCLFCGSDFFELEVEHPAREGVSINKYMDHVNHFYRQLDELGGGGSGDDDESGYEGEEVNGGEGEYGGDTGYGGDAGDGKPGPVGERERDAGGDMDGGSEMEEMGERPPLIKVRFTSPVTPPKSVAASSSADLNTHFAAQDLSEMEEYCRRTIGIESSFILEAMRTRINIETARSHLDRAGIALGAHDVRNAVAFLGKCDKEMRERIIEAVNASSRLIKDLEKDGANVRIMRNLVVMSFSSFEEGRIQASLYYLRRIIEETERMKNAPDPASYLVDEDYYAMIGVDKDASFDEIRKKYLKRISPLHPDMHAMSDEETRANAEEKAKVLNRAYNTLKHSQERRLYDIAMGFSTY